MTPGPDMRLVLVSFKFIAAQWDSLLRHLASLHGHKLAAIKVRASLFIFLAHVRNWWAGISISTLVNYLNLSRNV